MATTTDLNVAAPARPQGYLHNRWIDFICLGGGSLPILCFLFLLPADEYFAYTASTALLLSHFINNPHFANSYQIFYSGFKKKSAPGAPLRWRYLFAAVGVPVIIVSYFIASLLIESPEMLGLSVNAMLFTVGWHYVKQGYGILMVEAVLKKAFFTDREKTWLRYNALVIWILSWCLGNRLVTREKFFGLEALTLDIPDAVFWSVAGVAAITSLITAAMMAAKAMRGPLPVNGLLAYVTSAYVWLVLVRLDPLLVMVVPLFHSLQYMAVVWRYQLNKEHSANAEEERTRLLGLFALPAAQVAMIRFVWFGILLGALWFWAIPTALDVSISYREDLYGKAMFLAMILVFINIHHYFLDNVMWRRENPDMREYLFR